MGIRSFVSVSVLLLLAGPRLASAGSPDPADIFGVDLGTTRQALQALAAPVTTCQEYGPPTNVLACRRGLAQPGSPAPDTTSFWLTDDRVSRIFQFTSLRDKTFSRAMAAFHREISRVQAVLGRAPSVPAAPEPAWFASLSDEQKLAALAQRRLAPKASWNLPRREVSVSLLGEKGMPALVVTLERSQPAGCGPEDVAGMLMNLFPPAPTSARVAAAEQLAACRVTGASGALAAAAAVGKEDEFRIEAVRALGALGPKSIPHLEAIARDRDNLAPAKEALAEIARLRDLEAAPAAAPALRQVHAEATPAPPSPEPPLPPAVPTEIPPGSPPAPAVGAAAAASPPALAASPAPPAASETRDAESEESSPAEPAPPPGPPDGSALALATSLVSGGVWGGGLSLLAQQDSTSVVLLVGSAGAVIGGGTAWGLTHFGLRPSPAQALWFANTTAWGTLAGLAAWAGSGSDNLKLKWGLVVGGESLGMGLGVVSARRWNWTPSQTIFADSLVIGSGLAMAGGRMLAKPTQSFRISPLTGYAAAPVMLASAVASRFVAPTGNDLHLLGAASLASSWTAGLLSRGLDTDPSTRDARLRGGLLLGLGAGYLGAVAASPFVEVSSRRTWISGLGLLAGNAIGLGAHMMATPDDSSRWALGAGIGGLSLGVGTFLAFPRLQLGDQAVAMGLLGALYGAGTWGVAAAASHNGRTPEARVAGGLLSLGTAGGIAGLLASGRFRPDAIDDATALGSAALGVMGGIGIAKLAAAETGNGELAGTLAGSAAGLAAGATFAHYARLRPPDAGAAFLGAGYGALVGALAPSLAAQEWKGFDRRSTGGILVGVSGGALAATALSHALDASSTSVKVGAAGATLGLGMGLGTGLLWAEHYSQPARIGAVAGASAGLLGSLLLERPLHLDQGLGDSAVSLGLVGIALGAAEGVLVAGLADPSGMVGRTTNHAIEGGLLLGGSAGLASGLVLSKFFTPSAGEAAVAAGGALAGGLLGRGLLMTASSSAGRPDTIATLAGSMAGLAALSAVEHASPLSSTDLCASTLGLAYGGLVGALAPSLGDAKWGGFSRGNTGGLLLGLGGGSLAAASLSHLADPRPATLAVAGVGGLLGLNMGLGTGLLWPSDYSRPARIGAVAGVSAGIAGALVLERPLHLGQGFDASSAGLATVGAGVGIAEGVLLAGLVGASGQISRTSGRQLAGGALLGGSAGLASGLVLSRFYDPAPEQLAATVAGGVLGGAFGRGLAMTASAREGSGDTVGTMAGSLAGVAATAAMEHVSPLTSTDFLAAGVGLGFGGLGGALAPTLGDRAWGGWRRENEGTLMLGLSGGAVGAALLGHATDARPRTIGLGALGGLDGALTGLGIGLLADDDPQSSRGARIGAVSGAAGGLALGLGLWPRIDFDGDGIILLSAASAVGGWTGLWSQVLGHSSLSSVDTRKLRAGLLAGAGGTSLLTSALLPVLHVDRDLVGNALVLDGLFSGAGAGIGALASRRADAPVWGMLGGGTAGLVLGGVLHDAIDFGDNRALVTFAALEGLWAGGWLPYVLRPAAEVTELDHVAGLAAGGLGGAGLAVLMNAAATPAPERLHLAAVGSAIGASLAGGSVLLADELHDQRGGGLMLGGTAAGLGVGALLSPYAPLDSRRGLGALAGAGLGLGESLVFAWSGRATSNSEYAGAGLVGAGLGATLALASGADASELSTQQTLVASGFLAWGAWVGSFSGAFAHRDPHEVVMGGLAAANLGFLAGYGALRYDLVDPRDFGWLSLGGALGAALGGGLGAAFSTSTEPRPVLAGLALGPLVGIGTGSIIVPRLRHRAEAQVSFVPAQRIAPAHFEFASEARPSTSADVLAGKKPSRILAGLKLAQKSLFDVTDVIPVFGALPPAPGDTNPAPFFVGLSGRLR